MYKFWICEQSNSVLQFYKFCHSNKRFCPLWYLTNSYVQIDWPKKATAVPVLPITCPWEPGRGKSREAHRKLIFHPNVLIWQFSLSQARRNALGNVLPKS